MYIVRNVIQSLVVLSRGRSFSLSLPFSADSFASYITTSPRIIIDPEPIAGVNGFFLNKIRSRSFLYSLMRAVARSFLAHFALPRCVPISRQIHFTRCLCPWFKNLPRRSVSPSRSLIGEIADDLPSRDEPR